MFEKLVKSALKMGLFAQESKTAAGRYYDGVEHGESFPVVLIDADYADYHILPQLEKLLKRRGFVYDWRPVYGGRCYVVWRVEDWEKARRLDDVAAAFLDAFHGEHHRQYIASGRTDCILPDADIAACILAGRRAVAAMNGRA